MRGVNAQGTQHVGDRREASGPRRITGRATRQDRAGVRPGNSFVELREARKAKRGEVYRRRRFMAISLLVLGAVALVVAVFVQTRAADTAERAVPIDPNNAGPDTVLAGPPGSISPPRSVPRASPGSATIPRARASPRWNRGARTSRPTRSSASSPGERRPRGSTTTLWTRQDGMDPRPVPSTSAQRRVPPSTPP